MKSINLGRRGVLVIIAVFFFAIGISPVSGVPAAPVVHTLEQNDGSKIYAKQWGDEWNNGLETLDGYDIIFEEASKNWVYATISRNGRLVSSNKIVGNSAPDGIPKHITGPQAEIPGNNGLIPKASPPQFVPVPSTGTFNLPVLLINFPDQGNTYTKNDFEKLLFDNATGSKSLRDYFREVSYGNFNITSGPMGVSGWYVSNNSHSYYGYANGYQREAMLAKEAIQKADESGFDFSSYDSDHDGYVDAVVIVHSGNGMEISKNGEDIWSHTWSLSGAFGVPYTTSTGLIIDSYTIQPEILSGGQQTIGVFAHEFGHIIGLPDLYGIDPYGNNQGIGEWSLMAVGAWNMKLKQGDSPAHPDAWSRSVLGWVSPREVNKSSLMNISQVETNAEVYRLLDNPDGVKDWSSGSGKGEYFLIENREQIGFDSALPGEGLLIWHIDESMRDNNDKYHKLVDLKEANGAHDLDNNINSGDPLDPWYNSGTGFTENTMSNSNLYNGSASGIRVTSIGAIAPVMTATMTTGLPSPAITLVSPSNNSILNQNWVNISITSNEPLDAALLEWNGVDETMLGSGLNWYRNKTISNGKYSYRIRGNDTANNWNITETRIVTINAEPPGVMVNPAIIIRNGSFLPLNVTILDSGTGIKNATVNVSRINNSFSEAVLSYDNGFWKNSSVVVNASDGIYYLNITVYDNSGNVNNTEQIRVIVDNTPPIISSYQISYKQGFAANMGSSIDLNISVKDPIIKSSSSGVNTAVLDASVISMTGSITLINRSGYWVSNVVCDKLIADGNYSLDLILFDNAGNVNNSKINISIDNTPPAVSGAGVSSRFINVTDVISISATIISPDTDQSEVFAKITYPNGTSIKYHMNAGAASKFYYDLSDTGQYGRFTISIQANDTTGNTNSTQQTEFFTTNVSNKDNVILQENNPTIVNAPFSGTSLLMYANHTSIGSIKIVRSIINMTSQELIPNSGIFVLVNTSNSIKTNLSYFVISANYTDGEVSSFVESSLRLLKWNNISKAWEKPDSVGSLGNEAGVDTVNNFIWANVTTPGEFGVTGDIYTAPVAQAPASGSGGGGGGGGGSSGEEYLNIELKEKHDNYIFKDKVTSYAFSSKNNPILFVNITGNVNAGEITTTVEVLKNTSTLLKIPAPGTVFRNINFLVGTSGFSSSNKLKDATIGFRVYNDWLLDNGLVGSDVIMVRWNGSSWNVLETHQTGKDKNYTFFESKTVAFSAFAITGMKRLTPEASPMRTLPGTTSITNDSLNASKVSETALPVNWVIIMIILVGIGIFLFLKKGKLRIKKN